MIKLIRHGVPEPSRSAGATVWADFGAGAGNFTRALRCLLPDPASSIYAVEKDAGALGQLQLAVKRELHDHRKGGARIHAVQGDFTHPLDLPPLDGVLMANSLHFNRNQADVLKRIISRLRPGGRLLLVEYDLTMPRPWVPFPVPVKRVEELAMEVGLGSPTLVGTRRTAWSGRVMYAAVALLPG